MDDLLEESLREDTRYDALDEDKYETSVDSIDDDFLDGPDRDDDREVEEEIDKDIKIATANYNEFIAMEESDRLKEDKLEETRDLENDRDKDRERSIEIADRIERLEDLRDIMIGRDLKNVLELDRAEFQDGNLTRSTIDRVDETLSDIKNDSISRTPHEIVDERLSEYESLKEDLRSQSHAQLQEELREYQNSGTMSEELRNFIDADERFDVLSEELRSEDLLDKRDCQLMDARNDDKSQSMVSSSSQQMSKAVQSIAKK